MIMFREGDWIQPESEGVTHLPFHPELVSLLQGESGQPSGIAEFVF
jgi:hypothetical protein